MSTTKVTVVVPAITFAGLGAFLSAVLLVEYSVAGSREAVLFSRWATFPPSVADGPASSGIPVALLGLVYFLIQGMWLLVVGRLGWSQRLWHSLPMASALLASVVSIGLTLLMVREGLWCAVCLAAHAMNWALAIYVFLCRPEHAASDAQAEAAEARPVALALALSVCLTAVVWFGWENVRFRQHNQELTSALARANAQAVVSPSSAASTAVAASAEAPASPAGWILNSASPDATTVVVFTDLTLSPCQKVIYRLLEELAPLFQGRLRVAIRHFPQCASCTTPEGTALPPACAAAYLAEAGRQQGGWTALLRVMRAIEPPRSAPWTDEEVIRLALDLGLNPQKFVEDWHSAAIRRRVAEDVSLARELGVTQIPAVFVNGQQLDPHLRDKTEYWQQLAGQMVSGARPSDAAIAPPEPMPSEDNRPTPYSLIPPTATSGTAAAADQPETATGDPVSTFESTPAHILAQGLLQRYDLNHDGKLQPPEYPRVAGDFAKYDIDGDGVVTVDELKAAIAIAQRLRKSASPKPAR